MKNQRTILLTAAIVMVQLMTACGELSSKQKSAAQDAIADLKKIEAAVQVGVNYQQYGMLLIDAKDKVNKANAVLHESELKNELNSAIDAYADASQAWSVKINSGFLRTDRESDATLIKKYSLKQFTLGTSSTSSTKMYADANDAMQIMWGSGLGHLLRAAELLEKS